MRVCACTCIRRIHNIQIHIYAYIFTDACVYVDVHIYVHVCRLYVYVCTCVCVHKCAQESVNVTNQEQTTPKPITTTSPKRYCETH